MSELTTLFKNTADAIRSKTGDTATMKASQFPAKIQGISLGISQDEADARYLQLSGGTMTGDLILNGAPTGDNQAATKAYVDSKAGPSLELLGEYTLNIQTTQKNILLTLNCTYLELFKFSALEFLLYLTETSYKTVTKIIVGGVQLDQSTTADREYPPVRIRQNFEGFSYGGFTKPNITLPYDPAEQSLPATIVAILQNNAGATTRSLKIDGVR